MSGKTIVTCANLMSILRAGMAGLVISISAASSVGAAGDNDALFAALELCFEMPADTAAATKTLTSHRWEKSPDDEATLKALLAAAFAGRLNLDDLPRAIVNAGFQAASILGNSSLGNDQPGFVIGDLTVATLGLNEGTPYCVLAGPEKTLNTFLNKATRTAMWIKSSGHFLSIGYDRNHLITSARFNHEDLLSRAVQFDTVEEEQEFRQFVENFLPEVVIQITSPKALEQSK